MIDVTVQNGTIDQKEIDAYIAYGRKKYPGKSIIAMDVTLDGDFVDLKYQFSPQPFERIRRITGKDEQRRHLAEMGFVLEAEVTVISQTAGNLILKVKESRIALDKAMANRILF